MFKLVTYPDDRLREICKPVEPIDTLEAAAIEPMFDLMDKCRPRGVGMAAPQVGVMQRFFVMYLDGVATVFVNPVIISQNGVFLSLAEGCLSCPGFRHNVVRSKNIRIEYQDTNGIPLQGFYSDLDAAIIQHEIDHLDGKLFFERCAPKVHKNAHKILMRRAV